MNKFYVLFFLIGIALFSCDGRGRAYKSNVEVLKSNNLLESFSKQVEFFPNEPVKIFTDTLLSDGFQIKINYYSLENSFISKTKTSLKGSVIHTNHKNFEARLQVFKNDTLLIEQTLNKDVFEKHDTESFFKDAIMQFVWIDYENSLEDFITLNTSFYKPETDIYKDFCIQIDKTGAIEVKAINLIKKLS